MTDEQAQIDSTPIFKHVKLMGLAKLSATINLMESNLCERCGRTYYLGHLGKAIEKGQTWIKVVEERPGSYERHTNLCP